ncbi:LRR receptor-like serine/threonine-protein kinase GSO2 [Quercus robur]|uniref:LRR receptor-like serine/threonine-protein kinase GSO2 n=1 Tax=Quercus robur TaxID=38942 RepID=UPI002161B277|nr:LRR receptor-like serine/threonine-protein kinase GSO2 [Quercus robur]
MDFSRNNLSREIPAELTSLTLLNSLNLSWNQLTGKIPKNIGSLRQLETLDLSSKHLLGHIPLSMSSLTFLSHLNLSYNNLSGQIPSTNQFQTFNDPSIYEDFRDLFVGVLNSDDSELADRFTMLSSLPQLVFRFEHWVLPNLPFHKAKFDGALFRDSSSASIAVVVGDFEGNVIRALFERIGLPASVVEVEALACRRAVSFAIEIDKLAKKARYLLLPQFGLEEIPVDVSPFVMQDKFYVKSLIKFQSEKASLKKDLKILQEVFLPGLVKIAASGGEWAVAIKQNFSRPILECSNGSLEHLNLSLNQLIGNVPHSLGYIKRLRNLQLYINTFSSSIPLSIQNLSHLEKLDLNVNMMNITISELIGQLSELRLESAASLKELLASGFKKWTGSTVHVNWFFVVRSFFEAVTVCFH